MSSLLFITSTSWFTSAGRKLLDITNPIEEKFNELYTEKYANDEELESICIVFECSKERVIKDRNYISHKNKYADMRIWVDCIKVIKASTEERKQIAWDVITQALNNIRVKKAYKRIDEFEEDLRRIYWSE